MCMSRMFAFMSAVVTSAGVCRDVCGVSGVVKGCGFYKYRKYTLLLAQFVKRLSYIIILLRY